MKERQKNVRFRTVFLPIVAALTACSATQEPAAPVEAGDASMPDGSVEGAEPLLEGLARAYFEVRRAPADLEGISRRDEEVSRDDESAEALRRSAESVALRLVEASEIAAQLGLEGYDAAILDASDSLRTTLEHDGEGSAERAILVELDGAPEPVSEALLSVAAEAASGDGEDAEVARCLLARIEAYEIWCLHLAAIEEYAHALASSERAYRPVLGQMAELMAIRRQRRLAEEHRELARRSLDALAGPSSLQPILDELDRISLVEGFSTTWDRARETTRAARDRCQ